MANKKQNNDTLSTETTFTVHLDSGELVSIQASSAAEAVEKALKKE